MDRQPLRQNKWVNTKGKWLDGMWVKNCLEDILIQRIYWSNIYWVALSGDGQQKQKVFQVSSNLFKVFFLQACVFYRRWPG